MAASNGGTPAPLNLFLIPITDFALGKFFQFDVTNFNDAAIPSSYSCKVEDVIAGRTPTCSRIIVSYTDLGVVEVTFTLSGTNDAGEVVTESQIVDLGNLVPTNKMLTKIVSLALTAQNLQLSVLRAANAGPLSIVKIRLEGEVETTAYA
jgi:hypothetical protein